MLAFRMQGTLNFASFVLFELYSEMSRNYITPLAAGIWVSMGLSSGGCTRVIVHGGQKNCNMINVTKVLLSLL